MTASASRAAKLRRTASRRTAKLRRLATDAKKALGALLAMESAAVGFGLLDSTTAGVITGCIGVATAGLVYALKNE